MNTDKHGWEKDFNHANEIGHILTLPPERGCRPPGGTSRRSDACVTCWNTPDAAELFNTLRLVPGTQPRSKLVAFGGQCQDAPNESSPEIFCRS